MKLEEKMYNTVVRPAMIYGAWDATKKDQKRFRCKSCEHVEMERHDQKRIHRGAIGVVIVSCNVTETIEVVRRRPQEHGCRQIMIT